MASFNYLPKNDEESSDEEGGENEQVDAEDSDDDIGPSLDDKEENSVIKIDKNLDFILILTNETFKRK